MSTPQQLVLYVNSPPVGGACNVLPRRGAAFGTLFNVSCRGWSDAEADLPLTYGFAAGSSAAEATYALVADSINSTVKVGPRVDRVRLDGLGEILNHGYSIAKGHNMMLDCFTLREYVVGITLLLSIQERPAHIPDTFSPIPSAKPIGMWSQHT